MDKNNKPTNENEKTKQEDILDDVRAIELATKKLLLIKALSEIKQMAKSVLETKAKCNALLSEIGVSGEDAKRIIDFVNSRVELTDDDKTSVLKWARDRIKGNREVVEKKVEEDFKPFKLFYDNMPMMIGSGTKSFANTGTNMNLYSTLDPNVVIGSVTGDEQLVIKL